MITWTVGNGDWWTLAGWGGVGVALALLFLRFARRGDAARERRVLAGGLVIAALAYVAFALSAVEPARLALELAGVLVFAVPAYLGARASRVLLAAGWTGHGLWDGLLHLGGPAWGPEWYAALCVGFDFVVAAALVAGTAAGARSIKMKVAGAYE